MLFPFYQCAIQAIQTVQRAIIGCQSHLDPCFQGVLGSSLKPSLVYYTSYDYYIRIEPGNGVIHTTVDVPIYRPVVARPKKNCKQGKTVNRYTGENARTCTRRADVFSQTSIWRVCVSPAVMVAATTVLLLCCSAWFADAVDFLVDDHRRCRRPPHGPQQENSGVVVLTNIILLPHMAGKCWLYSVLCCVVPCVGVCSSRRGSASMKK